MAEFMELKGEVNPDDLEPTIDIDLKTQKRILVLFARLDRSNHYELLGVMPTAEKKEITSAYFDRMNEFHIDKFFGKNIGSFGPKLQRIVQQLTRANDVLTRRKTRDDYDQYLRSRNQTLGARESIPPPPGSAPPPGSPPPSTPPPGATPPGGTPVVRTASGRPAVAPIDVVTNIPRAPRAPIIDDRRQRDDGPLPLEPVTNSSPSGAGGGNGSPRESASAVELTAPRGAAPDAAKPGPRSGHDGSGASSNPDPHSRRTGAKADAARRLLARKMGARVPQRSPSPAHGVDAGEVRRQVDADMKARFDARKNQARDIIAKYTHLSEEAMKSGDWGSAVSAIRTAAQAAPDDHVLSRRVHEVQAAADKALAPRFLEQARYEEKEGNFERAARSYERAARGNDSAELYYKAAKCLLRLDLLTPDDKRKLVEFARRSVSLDNTVVDYRLALAKAYDVTGMRTSAQGEVRRALELDPGNKDAKELQKTLR